MGVVGDEQGRSRVIRLTYTLFRSYKNKHKIKKWLGNFMKFFYLRKGDFLVIKNRFSQYRYMIPVRKFEIRIRSKNLHIVYKNHLDSRNGRFWPFLVRYVVKP